MASGTVRTPNPNSRPAVLVQVANALYALGNFTVFCFKSISSLTTKGVQRGTLLPAAYQIGVQSIPVVALTGLFIGMVLAVQSYFQFHQLGMENRMGAMINITLVRELGPVLAATMLAGRIGSAIAAELGTMRVSEQIDAIDSMGISPIRYLVVPRVTACLLLVPALTIVADLVGVAGGFLYSSLALNIDAAQYFYNSKEYVTGFDLATGIIKSVFFGISIGLISCYHGFHCRVGARGVGRAATGAFVSAFVIILFLDLLLGIALDTIYFQFNPGGNSLL